MVCQQGIEPGAHAGQAIELASNYHSRIDRENGRSKEKLADIKFTKDFRKLHEVEWRKKTEATHVKR